MGGRKYNPKALPGGGLPIGATSIAIEKGWLWIVVDFKEA